jgi:arylsulfatase A-like enzyme
MYDIITRVPTVIWSPGRFEGGKRLDGLVQQMDLAPTILELAGVEVPKSMEAESLMPALTGEDSQGRDFVFAEHSRDGILQATEFMTMIRSKEWKLVHFLDEPFGQLFDLKNDPQEVNNLWGDPHHAEQKHKLLDALREWLIRSNYLAGEWSHTWR